jgi:GNAT superfamily N-acetyltransferase
VAPSEDSRGSGQVLQEPREVIFHPAVKKDIKRLDPQVSRAASETIKKLSAGIRHPSTHPLNGPLKGWEATDVTGFGKTHRVTHRNLPSGPIEVGHIGPHNYDQAVQRLAMGQAGPDYNSLSFHHTTNPDYWDDPMVTAHHPEHGHIGSLTYRRVDPRPAWGLPHGALSVQQLDTHPDHQRRGVASQLMHHLERQNPGVPIEHGERSENGKEWAKGMYGTESQPHGNWTLDGHPWSPEQRQQKAAMNQPIDNPREFERHLQGKQHVVDLHSNGSQDTLCLHHAHARMSLDTEHNMLGLSTGLMPHDAPEREYEVKNPRKGQCTQCASNHKLETDHLNRLRNMETRSPRGSDRRVTNEAPRSEDYLNGGFQGGPAPRDFDRHLRPWKPSLNSIQAVQQPPEGLTFQHEERQSGGSKWPTEHFLHAIHPGGEHMGQLRYLTSPRSKSILIHSLDVHPGSRRQGVGSALMDEMQNRHPDASIDHGDRTDDGKSWWSGYAEGKPVRRGRTANGDFIDLYHRTSPEAARAIHREKRMVSKESTGEAYFSTHPHGQVEGYGEGIVHVRVPAHMAELDDEFPSGEQHYRVDTRALRPEHFVDNNHTASFTPNKRVFTATCGLDHRLFDGDHLKPDVRKYIMRSVTAMWARFNDWSKWAIVYFAGSEASEWTDTDYEGNNDFDVLIGVDYDGFRKANPKFIGLDNTDITNAMNSGFRPYNGPVMLTIDGKNYGPFDRTTYVNPNSYDIKKIKPYAAYNVSEDSWAVKPPHLPHWSINDLPRAVQKVLRACDTLANDVLKLPEPERTQQGNALFEAWHSDRSRAFSERGEGWYDIANLREKWLDQEGVWAELVNCAHRWNEGLGQAPADWSNTPPKTSSFDRVKHLFGKGSLHHMFPVDEDGPASTTAVPWPAAARNKNRRDYDPEVVKNAMQNPHHYHSEEIDPRDLHATQPSITRAGVSHYMSDEYKTKGTTFADQHNIGNQRPTIYQREDGQNLILAGHHRAAAALLKGEPLHGVVLQGPWGPNRREG